MVKNNMRLKSFNQHSINELKGAEFSGGKFTRFTVSSKKNKLVLTDVAKSKSLDIPTSNIKDVIDLLQKTAVIHESVINTTDDEQLKYYRKIKQTHFAQRSDFSNDAPAINTKTKFFNSLTRKWEDLSLDEVNDRIAAIENKKEE